MKKSPKSSMKSWRLNFLKRIFLKSCFMNKMMRQKAPRSWLASPAFAKFDEKNTSVWLKYFDFLYLLLFFLLAKNKRAASLARIRFYNNGFKIIFRVFRGYSFRTRKIYVCNFLAIRAKLLVHHLPLFKEQKYLWFLRPLMIISYYNYFLVILQLNRGE